MPRSKRALGVPPGTVVVVVVVAGDMFASARLVIWRRRQMDHAAIAQHRIYDAKALKCVGHDLQWTSGSWPRARLSNS